MVVLLVSLRVGQEYTPSIPIPLVSGHHQYLRQELKAKSCVVRIPEEGGTSSPE
jgi:hypothetical protein